jgi:iron complex transport system ATP-binding protein
VLLSGDARARMVAYLPQSNIAHWPISVRDAVAIGRIPHGGGPGRERPADTTAIDAALACADAAHLAGRPVTELSSGERARVMLARALAVEAPVLLADEPIAALDPAHQLGVLALLGRIAATGATVLVVLHDLTLAARFASRVIVLDGGCIVADGAPRKVLDEPLLGRVFGVHALHLVHEGNPVLVPWLTQADLRR